MARWPLRVCAAALALACLSSSALAFAVSPNQAILNKLTTQKTITTLKQELNPYGLAAITFNSGKLKAGNFLATQWNDANNNPGTQLTLTLPSLLPT